MSQKTSHWETVCDNLSFNCTSYVVGSPRESGLLGSQNGSRGEQLGLSWRSQRASLVSLIYTTCIEGLPRQFDALLACLHQQSMLIFATIALDHPKSALESFQRIAEVLTVTLPRWHTRTFVRLF